MKNINIILVLALVTLLASCNLSESPSYSLNTTTVFSNTTDAQLALNGCYGNMVNTAAYGGSLFYLQEGASGIFWSQTGTSDINNLSALVLLNTNGYSKGVFTRLYQTIANTNGVIYGIDHGAIPSTTDRSSIKGQAMFIRALCYMNLGFLYERAVIVTEPMSSGRTQLPSSNSEDVVKQAANDFLTARSLLTDSLTTDPSKPNRTACNAFLAKIYYYLNDYATAKNYGDLVVGRYTLEPTYANLFKAPYKKSVEDIFIFNVSASYPTYTGSQLSMLFSPNGATTGTSWGTFAPTKAFFDYYMSKHMWDPRIKSEFFIDSVYRVSQGKVYVPCYPLGIDYSKLADPSNPDSTSLKPVVKVKYDPTKDSVNFYPWKNYTSNLWFHLGWPNSKKMWDPNQAEKSVYSHNNIRVLRYTDILLLMADVERALGNPTKALGYVNQVLNRARAAGNNGQPLAWTSADLTQLNLYHERLFELFGEGFSFIETRRLGYTVFKTEILDRHDRHQITIQHSKVPGFGYNDKLFYANNVDSVHVMKFPAPKAETDFNLNF